MRLCIACGKTLPDDMWNCQDCGSRPASEDGIALLAPEIVCGYTGYDATRFDEVARLQARHFWFRARNALILWAFERYCPSADNFFEVGCGSGFVLSALHHLRPSLDLFGSDLFVEGLALTRQRLPKPTLWQLDARRLPFRDEFSAIGAFDVLEHIEEDGTVLEQFYAALRPGGVTILTVPQHPSLWSSWDERTCHVRRYERGELAMKVEAAGFQLLRSTSFVSLLLPAMWASRRLRPTRKDEGAAFAMPPLLNDIFDWIMRFEALCIRCGVPFPVGGSGLVVARKPSG